MRRPQILAVVLDDLHVIADSVHGASRRAERLEKRLSAMQAEPESIDANRLERDGGGPT
jgi:hypothetical protein